MIFTAVLITLLHSALVLTSPIQGPCPECALSGLDHTQNHGYKSEDIASFNVDRDNGGVLVERGQGADAAYVPEMLPRDAEKEFHGVLMHGDKDAGTPHDHEKPEYEADDVKIPTEPQNPNEYFHGQLMHGDEVPGRIHDHETDVYDNDLIDPPASPDEPNKFFHGQLMHGDSEPGKLHDHETDVYDNDLIDPPASPAEPNKFFHGQLMHGDSEPGKLHDHRDVGGDAEKLHEDDRPTAGDYLHGVLMHGLMMHGDTHLGVDYSSEHADMPKAHKFSLKSLIEMKLEYDLLKLIDQSNILLADLDDYHAWMEVKRVEALGVGNNQPSFWENLRNSILYSANDADVKEDLYDYKQNTEEDTEEYEEYPERAAAVEGEGMEHELELIGNTGPINARHKIYEDYVNKERE